MAESPLFNHEPAPAVACPRCGRLFEAPIELEQPDGGKVLVRGHVQGDPVHCIPLPGAASLRGAGRDVRARRAGRKGR